VCGVDVVEGPVGDLVSKYKRHASSRGLGTGTTTTTVSIPARAAHEVSMQAIFFYYRTVDWGGTLGVWAYLRLPHIATMKLWTHLTEQAAGAVTDEDKWSTRRRCGCMHK
jgi:hypothetical protein